MNRSTLLKPALSALMLAPASLRAHCDTLDGPVAKAGRAALARGDVGLALVWVRPEGEAEVREAFAKAQGVRRLGGEAQALAERWFLETLVRVHRAGEGAPYTGLRPAGTDLGPAIPAGDRALETGDLKPVWKVLSDRAHGALHARFEAAMKARAESAAAPGDVAAGRRAVAAYVVYIHTVEGLFGAAAGPAGHGAHAEAGAQEGHGH